MAIKYFERFDKFYFYEENGEKKFGMILDVDFGRPQIIEFNGKKPFGFRRYRLDSNELPADFSIIKTDKKIPPKILYAMKAIEVAIL